MTSGRRRRIRVLLACPFDLAELRDHLVEVVVPRLARMLDSRGIDLAIEVVELPDPDDGSGLADRLRDLAEPDALLLGVIGSSPGAPVDPFPVELESGFPELVPYQGGDRLELLVRHALAWPEGRTPVFLLVTQPGVTGLDALRRAVRQAADRVLVDEDLGLGVEELGDEVLNAVWRAVIDREVELPEVAPEPMTALDENVQFTVYRPRTVRPMVWYDLLAFAHLAERRPDAPADDLDPLTKVRRQARQLLGDRLAEFDDARSDARQGIPSGGTLTFLPQVPGVRFNPERRLFRWEEDVHREDFRLRPGAELSRQTARGRLSVYLGAVVVAELDLAFRVDPDATASVAPLQEPPEHARTYRRIFASYSHRDAEIVRQFEVLATSLGDDYLRDVIRLRSGEDWDAELHRLIDQADVFQLFWSSNSMRSEQVRREWEYALSLHRPQFIRPTYWEDPLPSTAVPELPPGSLRRLHFHRLANLPVASSVQPAPARAPAAQAATPPTTAQRSELSSRSSSTPPPDEAPPRRRRAAALLLPLAGVVVVGAVAGTVLTGTRGLPGADPYPNMPPPSAGAAPSSQSSEPPPSAGAPPVWPGSSGSTEAQVATMVVTGAQLIAGPTRSRPGRIGTTYSVVTQQALTITAELINPRAKNASVTIRSGLACFDATGQGVYPQVPPATVPVPAGRVTTWHSKPITVPPICQRNPDTNQNDGWIWVESTDLERSGSTTIAASFLLS